MYEPRRTCQRNECIFSTRYPVFHYYCFAPTRPCSSHAPSFACCLQLFPPPLLLLHWSHAPALAAHCSAITVHEGWLRRYRGKLQGGRAGGAGGSNESATKTNEMGGEKGLSGASCVQKRGSQRGRIWQLTAGAGGMRRLKHRAAEAGGWPYCQGPPPLASQDE